MTGQLLQVIKANFWRKLFLAKYHSTMQESVDSHPENVSWLSHDIQKEIIEIIYSATLDKIKFQLLEGESYSIECNEVVSHKAAYMSIAIRYVYQNNKMEQLVALKYVKSIKCVAELIIKELDRMSLPLKNTIRKGFYGASNMSGKDHGV